jgi:GTPase
MRSPSAKPNGSRFSTGKSSGPMPTPAVGSMPTIAIVGRPNVGKSTLINRLVGKRQAIVDDQPGVTRDRSVHRASWRNRPFRLIDTGGVRWDVDDPFAKLVNEQVLASLQEADIVILLVDGMTGLTDADTEVAKWVRKAAKPTIVAVNKIDRAEDLSLVSEFYSLGMGDPMGISALHGSVAVGDLLEEAFAKLPRGGGKKPAGPQALNQAIRLTIAGRPNVGKSSLLNAILGQTRTIVSDVSGTTRDAIDVPFEYNSQPFILVDTAGIRRKTRVDYGVEMFSVDRAVRSIRASDVSVLVLDAVEGVTEQDKRIAQKAVDSGVGLVVVVNKWDLIPDKTTHTTAQYQQKLLQEVPSLSFAEVVFTSALTGQRVERILDKAKQAFENTQRRLTTHVVNEVFQEAFTISPPAPAKNKRFKLLYVTQVKVGPPTFVFFVNDRTLLTQTYGRYLERRLRERVELKGSPVVFVFRSRVSKTDKSE